MKRNFSVRMADESIEGLREVAGAQKTTPNKLIEAAVDFYLKAVDANNNRIPSSTDESGILSLLKTKSKNEYWEDFWKLGSVLAEDSHSVGKPTAPSVIHPAFRGGETAPGTKYPKGKKRA